MEKGFQARGEKDQASSGQLSLFGKSKESAGNALIKCGPRIRRVKAERQSYLQNILWEDSLLTLRLSLNCSTVGELNLLLQDKLPQNSAETRRRHASVIARRFFPNDELDQLPRRILRSYRDDALVEAAMRVQFLEAEPLVGRLVAERLWVFSPGTELSRDFFTSYCHEVLGRKDPNASYRCCTAARVLGWTTPQGGRFYVTRQHMDETAALLIFHHHYAPAPQVIDIKRLLADPAWKYAGFAGEDAVRGFIRKLETKGLISRYAVVDRLEQATTRYPLDYFLEKRIRV